MQRRLGGCRCWATLIAILTACTGLVSTVLFVGGEPGALETNQVDIQQGLPAGTKLTVDITFENVSTDEQTITAIGLEQSLTDHLRVVSVLVNDQPQPTRAPKDRDYPMLGAWTDYSLDDLQLAGNERLHVVYTLVGDQPGEYTGDMIVWVKTELFGIIPFSRAYREPLTITVH